MYSTAEVQTEEITGKPSLLRRRTMSCVECWGVLEGTSVNNRKQVNYVGLLSCP